MLYKTIKILKEEIYRSTPFVNMTDDFVRVTLLCSRNEWREIKRHLNNEGGRLTCTMCKGTGKMPDVHDVEQYYEDDK